MLVQATLNRRYSASPNEGFFTGDGRHRFNNFRPEDNNRQPSLSEFLRESINLPFVRLMRDIVKYSIEHGSQDRRRKEYLVRFADREGVTYLQRFWVA